MVAPKPLDRQARRRHVQEIVQHIQAHYGSELVALGTYGSVARHSDGPYSDIEMHCVIRGEGYETSFEWTVGDWKAEVDVYTPDMLLGQAAEVDSAWPITHGAYVTVEAVFDPQGFFPRLRQVALGQPDEAFQAALHDAVIGEMYELVGKIRNARAMQHETSLPLYVVELARFGACLIGLGQRRLFTSSAQMFTESLTLPDRPEGYDPLCQLVRRGELSNFARLAVLTDNFWAGVVRWAQAHGIQLVHDLADLLSMAENAERLLESED